MTGKTNNRIGILGGTFNPVHLAHLALADRAVKIFALDKVLFIPCSRPPHKKTSILAETAHRLAMLKLAMEDKPHFEISKIEINRRGPSYTIDTIRELKKMYPSAELHFIVGADSLLELHMWKDIEKLLKLCKFVTFGRPGINMRKIQKKDLLLPPPWPKRLLENIVRSPMADISSSDIRRRVAERKSIRYLVPKDVAEYIDKHDLYAKQQGEKP